MKTKEMSEKIGMSLELFRKANPGEQFPSLFDGLIAKLPSGSGEGKWKIGVTDDPDPVYQKAITGVILAVVTTRAYWPEPFGSGEKVEPECSSFDGFTGTGNPGGPCGSCPMNKFAAGGKPCREVKYLMVACEDRALPLPVSVPPGSLKGWKGYANLLIATKALPFSKVVTEIGLNPATNKGGIKYWQSSFRMAEVLKDDGLDQLAEDFRKASAPAIASAPAKIEA